VERLAIIIDRANRWIGRGVAWLVLALVLVQFSLVILRYVFGIGSITLQESLLYMHGALFLLAAGYTLLNNGHVRVDVFYRRATAKRKALVDAAGTVFLLLPFCVLLWLYATPYVAASWAIREGSRETSGIQAVFLLKGCILAFVLLLALQGLALLLRSLLVLANRADSAASPLSDEAGKTAGP